MIVLAVAHRAIGPLAVPTKNIEPNMSDRTDGAREPTCTIPREPRGRVLVVEDDYDLRRLTRFLLIHLGYHVEAACDAGAAMRVVADSDKPFDLLLCDVVLPYGIGGAPLAEELSRINPAMKTIFMSGYPEQTIKAEGGIPDGAVVIMKPFRQAQLEDLLRKTLEPEDHGG